MKKKHEKLDPWSVFSNKYFATGPYTQKITCKEVVKYHDRYFIEYNHKVGMYRINHPYKKITHYLMGYSPHKKALIKQLQEFLDKHESS